MKLGDKHHVCCLLVFRLIIHCFAATTVAVRQQFSVLNVEIPLSRDVLPFPSCAVCAAELTKSCNRMQFLTQSSLFWGFFVGFFKPAGLRAALVATAEAEHYQELPTKKQT